MKRAAQKAARAASARLCIATGSRWKCLQLQGNDGSLQHQQQIEAINPTATPPAAVRGKRRNIACGHAAPKWQLCLWPRGAQEAALLSVAHATHKPIDAPNKM